eukprot:TRINITY_DN5441_c0_g2_i1.p1 TRINITY_DN5441_c0_g2~~TRINITY_DN5441_c0_g2_i1.p1  ORF type:complete len:267 (+),score=55.38 TRINITY_DN5441_c0_g2_i1:107-907(+)
MNEKTSAYIYYFWACLCVIFIVGFANLFILIGIIQALGISIHGLNTLEFLPNQMGIKFTEDLHVNNVTSGSGILTSFSGEPLYVHAQDELSLSSTSPNGPRLSLSKDHGLLLEGLSSLKIQDPLSNKDYFDSESTHVTWEDSVENLLVDEVNLESIHSPLWKDLLLQSESSIDLLGAEGISVDSKDVKLEAGESIVLSSESKIVIDGEDIRLDPLALPIGGGSGYPGELGHFKVCICLPSGLIYSIPENVSGVLITCDDKRYSPCN